MNIKTSMMAALLLVAPLATACDDGGGVDPAKQEADCKAFAEHVAEVLVKEHDNKEPAERDKMVEATVKSCVAAPPSKEAMDCAMKAQTGRDIKACDESGEKE